MIWLGGRFDGSEGQPFLIVRGRPENCVGGGEKPMLKRETPASTVRLAATALTATRSCPRALACVVALKRAIDVAGHATRWPGRPRNFEL